ncbi:DUF362 domain-containing protein [Desulfitibacter alkalitolerans]|uniref:DUF362 domain-containing protein n=1 Tax=Desulfitibacter alkalitolerans TaxID=264641 RepID=UPI000480D3DD|nr:DUF362 domain-containing protein [Desulfitibacter alkalitolerans]
MPTQVTIAKTSPNPSAEDLTHILINNLNILDELGELIKPDSRILLKPNASVCFPPSSGRNTDHRLIEAIINLLMHFVFKEIIIGESAIIGTDTMQAYEASEIMNVAKKTGVQLVDLKKEHFNRSKVKNGLVLDSIEVSRLVNDTDVLINIPKLKTISSVPVSIGLKNLKGLISDAEKKRFHHTNLNRSIVDLNKVIQPHFTIVDGIIASEMYEPKEMNVIIAGKDILAVDTVGCLVMV